MSDFRIEMSGRVWDMPYGAPEAGAAPGSTEAKGAPGKFYLGFKTKDVNVKYADGACSICGVSYEIESA